jgi:6-phosphofructokinase 1
VVCIAEGSPVGDQPPPQRRIEGTDGDKVRFGGAGTSLAAAMEDRLGVECRSCAPGHLLRGGAPVAADRELAQRLAVAAVELLFKEHYGRVVLPRGGAILDGDILKIGARVNPVPVEHPLWKVASALRIYTGD